MISNEAQLLWSFTLHHSLHSSFAALILLFHLFSLTETVLLHIILSLLPFESLSILLLMAFVFVFYRSCAAALHCIYISTDHTMHTTLLASLTTLLNPTDYPTTLTSDVLWILWVNMMLRYSQSLSEMKTIIQRVKEYLTSVSYQRTEGAHLNDALFYAHKCGAQAHWAMIQHTMQQ